MSDKRITEKILNFIEENLKEDLTLEKIAAALNYSKFYTARKFKEDTGITLYQYIRGRRMDKAAADLVTTNRSVLEIAFEAGYGSQQAFTQAFHDVYGDTPQEYRRIGTFRPRQNRIEIDRRTDFRMFLQVRTKGRAAA